MVLYIPECKASTVIMEKFPSDQYCISYLETGSYGQEEVNVCNIINIMITEQESNTIIIKFIKLNSLMINDEIMDCIKNSVIRTDLVDSSCHCTGSIFNKYFTGSYVWYTPDPVVIGLYSKIPNCKMFVNKNNIRELASSVSYVSEVIIPDDAYVELGDNFILVDTLIVTCCDDLRQVVQIKYGSRILMDRFPASQYKITYFGSKLIGDTPLDIADVIEFLVRQPKPDMDLIKEIIQFNPMLKVTMKLLKVVPINIICSYMKVWAGDAFNKVYGTDFMRMFTEDRNHNGFQWEEGINQCPNWDAHTECSNGLYFISPYDQKEWEEYCGKIMHWKSHIRIPDYTTVRIEYGKYKAEHIEVIEFEKI